MFFFFYTYVRAPDSEYAEFSCADIECPEFFDMEYHRCGKIRHKNMCCATDFVCDPTEVARLPKCYVDNKEYLMGDPIHSGIPNCYQCFCTENFDNTTIIGNPDCRPVDCGTTLNYLKEIYDGCAPVYLENTECCPIEWHCRKIYEFILQIDLSLNFISSLSV